MMNVEQVEQIETTTETIQNSEYRILIVEDNIELLESMQFMLKRKGYSVFGTTSGVSALNILNKQYSHLHPIDLLITDIKMPGMDGEALIQAVHTFDSKMRILVMTAFGDKNLILRIIRFGCRDFIDKPFRLAEMANHVTKLLYEIYLERLDTLRKAQHSIMEEKKRTLIHDLNNLLNSTLVYSDLALRDIEENHPIRKKIIKLSASAQVASEIALKLLQMKKESKRLMKVKTEITMLLKNIYSVLTAIAPKGVEVHSEIQDEHVWVEIDPERVSQALMNLGMNAFDAMPEGGILSFSLMVEKTAPNQNKPFKECVCIIIKDTGTGMSEETLQNVLQGNFTTKLNGHGLGMQVVRITMQDHYGWMKIHSELNKGTEIKLYFPIEMT